MNTFTFENIVGIEQYTDQYIEYLKKIANSNSTILITGETGVGKSEIARLLKNLSRRKDALFTEVNCGSLPESLLESALFGHKKGSFTGADRDHIGYFEETNGGTLFLDEIAETSIEFQTKLLRVIQNKVIRKVGDNKDTTINVRVICATNKDLSYEVKKGKFREDLYYRINTMPVDVRPLRERIFELPKLIEYFIHQANKENQTSVSQVSPALMKILRKFTWKGNIRELKSAIEFAVAIAEKGEIQIEHLPNYILSYFDYPIPISRLPIPKKSDISEEEMMNENNKSVTKYVETTNNQVQEFLKMVYHEAKDNFEKLYLENLARQTKGNITKMSRISKIIRHHLYQKLEKYNINLVNYRKKK